jgi:hypothetical protein
MDLSSVRQLTQPYTVHFKADKWSDIVHCHLVPTEQVRETWIGIPAVGIVLEWLQKRIHAQKFCCSPERACGNKPRRLIVPDGQILGIRHR